MEKLTRLSDRMRLVLKAYGVSQRRLAAMLRVTPTYVSDLVSEKKKSISMRVATIMRYTVRCSETWILTGAVDTDFCRGIAQKMQQNWKSPRALAERVHTPQEFIEAILAERISPSPELAFAMQQNLEQTEFDGRIAAPVAALERDPRIVELEQLLCEDPELLPKFLEVLRARKKARDSMHDLQRDS
jgi:plasmid maintenance system antidote protein VapI